MSYLINLARLLWKYLKEISGDNDHARYLAGANEDGTPVMTAEQFYLWQLRQKYSRINRCC